VEQVELLDDQHQSASASRRDWMTAGSRATSSGVPSAIATPWCSTRTRDASAITACMACSISTTLIPVVRLSSRRSATIWSTSAGRNPPDFVEQQQFRACSERAGELEALAVRQGERASRLAQLPEQVELPDHLV